MTGAAHHMHAYGRRRQTAGLEGTVHFAGETKAMEGSLMDKAQEYDRALRQSQFVASARRRGVGMNGSVLAGSTQGPSASSVFGGFSTAQSAVLGDSQGSVRLENTARATGAESEGNTPMEELELDGGVGGSYVDGGKRSRPDGDGEEEEEDGMEDGGVLGLLAQIYGRKEGAAGVL